LQILSDDGLRTIRGVPCKELGRAGRFRSFWLNKKDKDRDDE
jgi:hypothetical protein